MSLTFYPPHGAAVQSSRLAGVKRESDEVRPVIQNRIPVALQWTRQELGSLAPVLARAHFCKSDPPTLSPEFRGE